MSTNLSFFIYLVNLPRYLFLKKTSLFTSSLTSIRYTSFSWSIVLNRWRFCCCWATLDSRYDMCSSLSNSWKVGCLESEFSKFSRFLTTRRGFHWENEELLMFNYHGGAYYSNTFEKCFLLGILGIDTIHWNCLHGVNYKIKDDFSALQRLELHGSHRAFRFTILFIISLIQKNIYFSD